MSLLSKLTIIIPTFYPGKIIVKCLKSLPKESEIIIVDNGEDIQLLKIIQSLKIKIKHYKIGDVGLPKSFNYAVKKSKNESILITQPDVQFEKNSILNLLKVQKKYPKAGIVSPLLFEKKKYSAYDHLNLKLDKNGKLAYQSEKNKFNKIPSDDICVEAVNATAMLLRKKFINKLKGWDENIYTYHEDLDICLRLRKKNLQIIKTPRAIAHHVGFGSHSNKNKEKAEKSRNWHYCWSSLYFKQKHASNVDFFIFYLKNLIKYFLKSFVNFCIFNRKKTVFNFMRLRACINYLFIKKASFRVKI